MSNIKKYISINEQIKMVNEAMHAAQDTEIEKFKKKYINILPNLEQQKELRDTLIEIAKPFVEQLVKLEQLKIDVSLRKPLN